MRPAKFLGSYDTVTGAIRQRQPRTNETILPVRSSADGMCVTHDSHLQIRVMEGGTLVIDDMTRDLVERYVCVMKIGGEYKGHHVRREGEEYL